ncbi:MAG: hypothetical protein CMO44_14315 [Verrucomicrobiales bacterium]|nr:hypothetical protein [Verrucomicrobiales bacterium]
MSEEARSFCDLGKIEIPIVAEWPSCQDMRIDRWVLNSSEEFFKFIARIEHEKLLEKIFHEVTISNNGRHNTKIVVRPVTCDTAELAAFNHVISIILADKLMMDGYHYPPIDSYFDERNRSILDCKIKIKPCFAHFPEISELRNTNFEETLSCMGLNTGGRNGFQSLESMYFPKDVHRWVFKLEICISLSNRCLTTWYSNDSVFARSNRSGSCITHRIPFLTLLNNLKNLVSRDADLAPSIFSSVDLSALISESDDIRCKTSNYNRRTCENAMSWIQESHTSNTHNSFNFSNSAVIDILSYPPNFDDNLRDLFNNFPVQLQIHQKNAINRMLAQEQVDLEEKLYIKINENYKFCPITNSFSENQASHRNCRGGFLCDDTGLGKTMSILSLCACTSKKGPSLIVVPVSVLHHWKRELSKLHNMNLDSFNYYDDRDLDDQDVPNLLHFYVYYGQSRIRNPRRLCAENNVIITSYATLMRDFTKLCNIDFSADNVDRAAVERASPLHFIDFQRLVLDESHKIPTSSKLSLLQIKTRITWCVSATPFGSNRLSPSLHAQLDIILNKTPATAWTIHNTIDEPVDFSYYGLLTQPRNTVVDINPKAWRTHIMAIDHEMHPLMNNHMLVDRLDIIFGPCILVHLLSKLVIRNTVERANSLQRQVLIPSINYVNIITTLSNEQNAEYASILLFVKNMIHRYQRNGATCLRRFNTLRQWLSLSGCNIASEVSPSHSMTQTPPVLSHEAREALGITPDETCSVCLETFTQPCLLPCNHFLCYSCVLSIHNHARGRRDHRCPLCRNNYVEQELRLYEELPAPTSGQSAEDQMPQKIQKVIEYLTVNNLQKCVIFSEFKATHEVLKKWFNQCPDQNIRNISVMALNGTLTAAARNKMMLKFETEPNCILILSVRACVAGINLQSAHTVVFMEPMISKSDEHQAIGRVRRIGQQSHTVNVVKLVYENTIEEKLSQVGEGWRPNVHNMLSMLN